MFFGVGDVGRQVAGELFMRKSAAARREKVELENGEMSKQVLVGFPQCEFDLLVDKLGSQLENRFHLC